MSRTYSMMAAARACSLLMVAAAFGGATAAEASAAEMSFMRLGRQAAPPPGYLALCQRLPSECGLQASPVNFASASGALRPNAIGGLAYSVSARHTPYDWSAAFGALDTLSDDSGKSAPDQVRISFDRHLLADLKRVTRAVNARISATSDIEAFGQEDFWALPLTEGLGRAGNCKHYVLEKRRALIDMGVDAAALSIAVVRTPSGEVHAVLVVSTSAGDYVLDNLTPWVVKWSETGYTWIIRQGSGQQLDWFSVLS